MKRGLRSVLLITAVLLVSVPVSLVVTLALVPFWRWCEASTGFESIGHSGPAGWCYLTVFTLVALASLATVRMMRGR